MRFAAVTLALAATLAWAAGAQAAQRYATPTGSGSACTAPSPCPLKPAIEGAGANDEVIVAAGAYDLESAVTLPFAATGAWVHGELSAPAPTITAAHTGYALIFPTAGSRLSHVTVSNSAFLGHAINCANGATVERVRAFVDQPQSYAIISSLGTCHVRDSLARATGTEGIGVYAICEDGEPTLRNVTALAEAAGGVGVVAANFGSPKMDPACTLDVRNTLISGGAVDLRSFGVGLTYRAGISVSNSNFDSVDAGSDPIAGSANQSAAPIFVNPIAGDYRPAPGSPTIDAGAADPLIGPVDLDGNPRLLGAAPDIGALEFVPAAGAADNPAGRLRSLTIRPNAYRAAGRGGAIASARKKRRARAPVSGRVTYSLSAAATVRFTVERKLGGRRVGKRCVKQRRGNRRKKRCVRFVPIKGGFSDGGDAGVNRFRFSGRLRGKALRPGAYRLVGKAGGAVRRASFRIVR